MSWPKRVSLFLFLMMIILASGYLAYFVLTKKEELERPTPSKNSQNFVAQEKNQLLSFVRPEILWEEDSKNDGSPSNFDLFSRPSVSVQNGKIIMRNYKEVSVDDSLPLYLSAIKPKPYRIKVEGFARNKDGATIMFRDIDSNTSAECSVKERSMELKIRVESFAMQVKERNGALAEIPLVKIYDEISQSFMTLTDEQSFVDDQYIVIIRDLHGNEYSFNEVGSSVEIEDTLCTLRSFDRKNNTIKLVLRDANNHEFRKTLHVIR